MVGLDHPRGQEVVRKRPPRFGGGDDEEGGLERDPWLEERNRKENARLAGVELSARGKAKAMIERLRTEKPDYYADPYFQKLLVSDPPMAGLLASIGLRCKESSKREYEEHKSELDSFVIRGRLNGAGVPDRMIEQICSGAAEERQPYIDLIAHDDAGKSVIFLAGPAGTGKSLAAAQWIAKRGGTWTTGERLSNLNLKAQTDSGEWAYWCRGQSRLVIDDLAILETKPDLLEAIIVRRFDARGKTVLTFNSRVEASPAQAVMALLGERTRSRVVVEGGVVLCLEVYRK
jgi:hypothetical protein